MALNIIKRIGEIKDNTNYLDIDISNLCDYNGSKYLSDIINEICDNNVDIYTYDLLEWLKNNYEYVEYANNEYGQVSDLIRQVQQAQFYKFNEEMYNNIDDALELYILDKLKNNNYEELNEEQKEKVNKLVQDSNNDDILPDEDDILNFIEGEI